jgi:hypothetical protein
MNVAARNSRLAKIASPSCTNMPPIAGGAGFTNADSTPMASTPSVATQASARRSSPRASSPPPKTMSSTTPSAHSSASGEATFMASPCA